MGKHYTKIYPLLAISNRLPEKYPPHTTHPLLPATVIIGRQSNRNRKKKTPISPEVCMQTLVDLAVDLPGELRDHNSCLIGTGRTTATATTDRRGRLTVWGFIRCDLSPVRKSYLTSLASEPAIFFSSPLPGEMIRAVCEVWRKMLYGTNGKLRGGGGLISGNNGTYGCRIRLEAEMMTNRISARRPDPVLNGEDDKRHHGRRRQDL